MIAPSLLVLDDDRLVREALAERLGRAGYDVIAASTLGQARAQMAGREIDVAFLDVRLPDGLGTEMLPELLSAGAACVVMTAHATVAAAAEALKQGAADYVEKPFTFERFDATLVSTLERTALRREVRLLRSREYGDQLIGSGPAMAGVMHLVEKAAGVDTTVLLLGETGTGKGLVARTLHRLSRRSAGPFVNVTCTDLTETLMESELFGHEKGAFTDARTRKHGLVEAAHGGTLFLDEIAELTPRLQGKLLRFLEERSFRRVGGTEDMTVDVRVVAATNRPLAEEVASGRFREDLYYRLRVFPIELPALRERGNDIAELAKVFAAHFAREFAKPLRRLEHDTLDALRTYPWPGNVRELRNVLERAVLLSDGPSLTCDLLPSELRRSAPSKPGGLDFPGDGIALASLEQALLMEALRRTDGNRTEAGRLLGLSRHQIRNRLRKYEIPEEGS